MALAERLRAMADADPRTDLLEFFGVTPDRLRWDGTVLAVGDETIPVADVRRLLAGDAAGPRRTVRIEDL
jgi:hypothetical protein